MKTTKTPSSGSFALRASALSLAVLAVMPSVQAANVYWTGSNGTWSTTASWSTDSATVTAPSSAPDSSSDVIFNMTGVNAAETITLGANAAVNSLTINNTSSTTFSGAAYHLSLGSGGLTVAAGSGTVSLSGIKLAVVATQTWTNNSSVLVSFNSGGYSYADSTVTTPVTLTFAGAGGWSFTRANYFVDNSSTGTLALVVDTTSNVKITNSQTYSGGTVIKGYLRPENSGALGTGMVTFDTSSGSSTLSSNFAGTMSNNFTVANGSGTAILTTVNSTNAPTYSGTFTLNNTTNALAVAGFTGATITISGRITGAGGIAKTTNNSTLVLSGSNDFQGGLTLSAGVVQLASDYALGTGTLTLTAGTVESDSNVRNISNALGTIGGNITFGSTTTGATGALNFTNTSTAALSTATTGTRTFTVNSDTFFANGFSGSTTNGAAAVGLIKAGSATMVMGGESTYTGVTTVNAGTLQVGDGNKGSIASGTVAVANGATLAFNQGNNTSYTGAITNAGTVKTIASGSNTLSGAISGTGGLVQSGAGTTLLTGTSTYTGATSVTGGKLVIGNLGKLGNTAVTVGSSGSLNVNGSIGGSVTSDGIVSGAGSIGGSLVITSGTLAPGDGVGTLTANGGLTVQSGALVSMQLDSLASYDKIIATGAVSLAGTLDLTLGTDIAVGNIFTLIDASSAIAGTFSTITIGGASVTITGNTTTTTDFTYGGKAYELNYAGGTNDLTLSVLAVPEPGTWAMMVSGLGCLVGLQRLRRKVS